MIVPVIVLIVLEALLKPRSKSKKNFLDVFCKKLLHSMKPKSIKSWKIEGLFSCDYLFAKYGPTKTKAYFGKSSFSLIFGLEMHNFMVFSIYFNRPKAHRSIFTSRMGLLAKFQFLPKISWLTTPELA